MNIEKIKTECLCDLCEEERVRYRITAHVGQLDLCKGCGEGLASLELPKERFRMELDAYESHWVVRDEMKVVWLNIGDGCHDIFTKEQAEKLLELVREVCGED